VPSPQAKILIGHITLALIADVERQSRARAPEDRSGIELPEVHMIEPRVEVDMSASASPNPNDTAAGMRTVATV
jgi:hypothetical protein